MVKSVPLGVRLTGDEFTSLQALAAQHVAFSVTEACPLRCSHCIVATVPAGDRTRTMPLDVAVRYAAELPSLAERNVRFVSFTGGEPLLAPKQIHVLSAAAVDAGMRCTVVTGCHWAESDAAARRVVERYSDIATWHLSTDVFHEEFVPRENVARAARAALAANREVTVRMAASVPLSRAHEAIAADLQERLPDGVPIVVQPVTQMGRGRDVQTETATARVPAWPCMPNGMVVRYDGTVAPCCAGLVDERDGHPFHYPLATEGLAAAHERWCTDPLLQLIRSVGFAPVLDWVAEDFPEHPFATEVPRHPCDTCVTLWRDPAVTTAIRRRADLPQNRAKVAELTEAVFGEAFMTQVAATV